MSFEPNVRAFGSLSFRDSPAGAESDAETDRDSLSLPLAKADDADESLYLRQERRNRERERLIELRASRPRKNMRLLSQRRLAQRRKRTHEAPDTAIQLTGDIDDDDVQTMSFVPPARREGEPASADPDDSDAENSDVYDSKHAGDARHEPEPRIPEWRQISMHARLFDDAQEAEVSEDPKYCFFCDCLPNRLDQEGSIRYKYLRSFVEDSWGQVDPVWLINKAQELYNQGLRPYTRLKLPWYRSVIYAHFTQHHPTMRFMLEAQLQTYMGVLRTIEENNMVEQNNFEPSRKRVNLQYADMYMKYCKEMRSLYRTLMETRSQNVGQSRV